MVYGGAKAVRNDRGRLLEERLRLSRRQEERSTREKNGKIEQNTGEGVPVVTDLERLYSEGALDRSAGDGRNTFHKPPRQDFHPE